MTRRYAGFAAAVAPLGTRLERVVLTPRLAWQLRLANGLQLMLGRDADQAEARLRRFVAVHEAALNTIQQNTSTSTCATRTGSRCACRSLKG